MYILCVHNVMRENPCWSSEGGSGCPCPFRELAEGMVSFGYQPFLTPLLSSHFFVLGEAEHEKSSPCAKATQTLSNL